MSANRHEFGSQANHALESALQRRRALLDHGRTDALRLFHSGADGISGLVIERFGPVLIVQLHEDRLADADSLRPAIEALHRRLNTRAVYLKHFVRDRNRPDQPEPAAHSDPIPWIGDAVEPEQIVRENGLRFLIRPYDGFSVGLFLEQRDNRARVRTLAAGRRVLNLFAYTCGFSVAAAAGGAAQVASVDLSRRFLEWGRRNFELNELDTAPHLFFASDTFDFYRRARRQNRRFDLIILDPPTFSRTRRPTRVFVLEDQIEPLLAGALELLEPGGLLLFSTNNRALTHPRIERALASAADQRHIKVIDRPPLPPDFPGDPDYARTILVSAN
jgi:23S rRNA (cytosine1962-C5)-methyltransferase